jgi:hypothetical protein
MQNPEFTDKKSDAPPSSSELQMDSGFFPSSRMIRKPLFDESNTTSETYLQIELLLDNENIYRFIAHTGGKRSEKERREAIYKIFPTLTSLRALVSRLQNIDEETATRIQTIDSTNPNELTSEKDELEKEIMALTINKKLYSAEEYKTKLAQHEQDLKKVKQTLRDHQNIIGLESRRKKITVILKECEEIEKFFRRKALQFDKFNEKYEKTREELSTPLPKMITQEEYNIQQGTRKRIHRNLRRIEEAQDKYYSTGQEGMDENENFYSRMRTFLGNEFNQETTTNEHLSNRELSTTLWHQPLPEKNKYEAVQYLLSPVFQQTKNSVHLHLEKSTERNVYEQNPHIYSIVKETIEIELSKFLSVPEQQLRNNHEASLKKLIDSPDDAFSISPLLQNSNVQLRIFQLAALLDDIVNDQTDSLKTRVFGLALERMELKPSFKKLMAEKQIGDYFYSLAGKLDDVAVRNKLDLHELAAIEEEIKIILVEILPFFANHLGKKKPTDAMAMIDELNSLAPNFLAYSYEDGPSVTMNIEGKGDKSLINPTAREKFLISKKAAIERENTIQTGKKYLADIDKYLQNQAFAVMVNFAEYRNLQVKTENINQELTEEENKEVQIYKNLMQNKIVLEELGVKFGPISNLSISLNEIYLRAQKKLRSLQKSLTAKMLEPQKVIILEEKTNLLKDMNNQLLALRTKSQQLTENLAKNIAELISMRENMIKNIDQMRTTLLKRKKIPHDFEIEVPSIQTIPVNIEKYYLQSVAAELSGHLTDMEPTVNDLMRLLSYVRKYLLAQKAEIEIESVIPESA